MSVLSRFVWVYRGIMNSTKEVVIRVMMGVLIFLGYCLLSLFMYAIMRRVMVPQKLHVKPVHLYFHPECQVIDNCPYPRAEFLLNDGKKLLSSGQHYHISLQLEAPESPVNEAIGVFMINITFYTTDHQFLSTSARPAMIKYKSSLLHTLSTFVFSFPLLLGLWHQQQNIDVLLYEAYYEPYGDGTISATVSILHHHVQLYSATLTIDANFGGFTYYLYQWPVTMTVIVVISIFISLCTCTLILWVRDVLRDYDAQRRGRRRPASQRQQAGTTGAGAAGVVSGTAVPRPVAGTGPQGQQGGGGGRRGTPGVLRGPLVMPRQPHSMTVGATDLPPYPQDGRRERDGLGEVEDRETPTPSEVSVVSTAGGIEDLTNSSHIGSGGVSEVSSVAGDIDTEATDASREGLTDILNTLRRDLEERERTGSGVAGEGEEGVRRRPGQLT